MTSGIEFVAWTMGGVMGVVMLMILAHLWRDFGTQMGLKFWAWVDAKRAAKRKGGS